MRAEYKIPKGARRRIQNELYLYWKNKKDLEELEQDIIEESPARPEVSSSPTNVTGNPTQSKALRLTGQMSTRAIIVAKRRIEYIENAIKRLNDEDKEIFELIFRDGYSQKVAYTIKGISKVRRETITRSTILQAVTNWGIGSLRAPGSGSTISCITVSPCQCMGGYWAFYRKSGHKNGGVDRSRTDLCDFADRCLTVWLPRLVRFFNIHS